MLTKKLIVPNAVTVHEWLVFVLNRVPRGGRLKGASSLYLFFFFPFSILGRNIPGKLDRNAFSFPNNSEAQVRKLLTITKICQHFML